MHGLSWDERSVKRRCVCREGDRKLKGKREREGEALFHGQE